MATIKPPKPPEDYSNFIDAAVRAYPNVNPDWLRKIIFMESSGDPNAVSSTGATGLTQISPDLAKQYGINPYDPKQNIMAAARHMSEGINQYGNAPEDILSYHNAGVPWKDGQFRGETWRYVDYFHKTGGWNGKTYMPGQPGQAGTRATMQQTPWQGLAGLGGGSAAPAIGPVRPLSMEMVNAMMPQPPTPTGTPDVSALKFSEPPPYPSAEMERLRGEQGAIRTDIAGKVDPYAQIRAEANAAAAGTQSYLNALPKIDPNDPRWNYTPYQPGALPSRQVFAPPEQPAFRQDPVATGLAGLASLVSPRSAGQFMAATTQGALAARQQNWLDAIRRQQMLQQQADVSYEDQLRGYQEKERVGEMNWRGAHDALAARRSAEDALQTAKAEGMRDIGKNVSLAFQLPTITKNARDVALGQAKIENLGDVIKGKEDEYVRGYNAWRTTLANQTSIAKAILEKGMKVDQQRFEWALTGYKEILKQQGSSVMKPLTTDEFLKHVARATELGISPQEYFAGVDPSMLPKGAVVSPYLTSMGALNYLKKQGDVTNTGLNITKNTQDIVQGDINIAKGQQALGTGALNQGIAQNNLLNTNPHYRALKERQAQALRVRSQWAQALSTNPTDNARRYYKAANDDLFAANEEVKNFEKSWNVGQNTPSTPGVTDWLGRGAGGAPPPAGGGKTGGNVKTFNPATGKLE